MSATDEQLRERLDREPESWAARLELASSLAGRGDKETLDELLRAAPGPPEADDDLRRLVEVAGWGGAGRALDHVLAAYSAARPGSAGDRLAKARRVFRSGDAAAAAALYARARELDPALADPGLETALNPAGNSSSAPGEDPLVALVVSDGERVHAREKDPDTREKISALTIAVIAHVILGVALTWWVVAQPRPAPPQIIASVAAQSDPEAVEKREILKTRRAPAQAAGAPMSVVAAAAASAVSLPRIDADFSSLDSVGMGDNLGMSMSLDTGGGGTVTFFGARSAARKIVFAVDVSASMRGSRDDLMRKELAKSVAALPHGVQYQIIFFSGPAWYAGGKPSEAKKRGEYLAHIVRDGGEQHVWFEGWDEKQRHGGERRSALYHYEKGPDRLPRANYLTASPSTIRQSLQHIKDTPLSFGTDWRWPLMMAMNMRPDVIFFMTDGAFGTGSGVTKQGLIDDLLAHNRRMGNARINTVCMMILQAREELEALADATRGEFTLVQEDGSVVRASQLGRPADR